MMKNLIITFLLLSSFSYGQFFESPQDTEGNSDQYEYNDAPDQGTDNDTDIDPHPTDDDPLPAPINNWALLLPLAGLAVGGYRLWRMKQERI